MKRKVKNESDSENVEKTFSYKRMKLSVPPSETLGFVRRSSRAYKPSKFEEDDDSEINFHKLQLNTLRKYKRVYKLSNTANITKARLATMIQSHCKRIPLPPEQEVISYFIHYVKTRQDSSDKKEQAAKKATREST